MREHEWEWVRREEKYLQAYSPLSMEPNAKLDPELKLGYSSSHPALSPVSMSLLPLKTTTSTCILDAIPLCLLEDISITIISPLSFKKEKLLLLPYASLQMPLPNFMEKLNLLVVFISSLPISFGIDWKILWGSNSVTGKGKVNEERKKRYRRNICKSHPSGPYILNLMLINKQLPFFTPAHSFLSLFLVTERILLSVLESEF